MHARYNHVLAILAFLLLAQGAGFARAEDVEINLDVLQGYSPPPMFDTAPATRTDVQSPGVPLTQLRLGSAPVPGRKPYFEGKSASASLKDQQPQPKTVVASANSSLPPLPRCRPSKFNASESFLAEARNNMDQYAPQASDITEAPHNAPPKIGEEFLSRDLSAQDVLASIDSDDEQKPSIDNHEILRQVVTDKISLDFPPDITELPAEAKDSLFETITTFEKKMRFQPRLEIRAYSTSSDHNESTARRISLARALDIRDFLVQKQVDPARLDIRPMGEDNSTSHKDRVDIILMEAEN